jgi:pimeloyl-ACP methyl ester carboxylesterase
VRGVAAMAPLIFVEASNLASIRNAKSLYLTTDMREKLGRHHDDADAVFMGWHDIWVHPDFSVWSIERDLRGIRCPLLAILGDDDEYSTPAQIAALERGAVNAESFDYLKLADCRHAPHRDQPEVVLDAIARFVDEAG